MRGARKKWRRERGTTRATSDVVNLARDAVVLATLSIVACSSDAVTVPSGSKHQVSYEISYGGSSSLVFIVAVDDSRSTDSASLRAAFFDAMRAMLRATADGPGYYGTRDPAAWHPVGMRVVVVRPSSDTTAVGPSDDAALAWTSEHATHDAADALASAIEAHVATPIVGAPYRLLDATKQTLDLVLGRRPAANPREAALAASLDVARRFVRVIMVTAKDDEGTEPVEADAFTPPSGAASYFDAFLVTPPPPSVPGDCFAAPPPIGMRVEQWQATGWRAEVVPLSATCLVDRNLFAGELRGHGIQECLSAPVARLSTGAAACRITSTSVGAAPCDPMRGMIDPLGPGGVRGGRTDAWPDGTQTRTCEILALTGDAERACRTTMACDGCGAGWCRTEVEGLVYPLCDTFNFRFVGGASPWNYSGLQYICDLER